jgi:hypothetical protein
VHADCLPHQVRAAEEEARAAHHSALTERAVAEAALSTARMEAAEAAQVSRALRQQLATAAFQVREMEAIAAHHSALSAR